MGKYKQWLHHQEVGARLRDEIAAHEAERERVLKLAPPRSTPLPEVSNPIIAALLGQALVTKAPAGGSGGNNAPPTESSSKGGGGVSASVKEVVAAEMSVSALDYAPTTPLRQGATATQEESKTNKAAPKPKAAGSIESVKEKPASPPSPVVAAPAAKTASQPDTIDPLLEQLLANAENAPADPLEALNLLASQGPNLTHGDAPQAITPAPAAPLDPPAPARPSAFSEFLSKTQAASDPKDLAAEPVTEPMAVGVETLASGEVSVRAETIVRTEKGRSDTDELVAARPTEGYTEPRLIVPQWLKGMELGHEQGGEKAATLEEDAEGKQRFSVSLPFENEEDMRLHESVERWWQRWRQQS